MIDADPDDWARCFARLAGLPPGPSSTVDTDLATTLQADRLFRIGEKRPALLHLEFQSTSERGIPRELMRYNTLADYVYDFPVESVLVLLRPKAKARDLTGHYKRLGTRGNTIAEFRYHVVRVWEYSVDFWLNGGIGLAPLAMVADEADGNLERCLARFEKRVKEVADGQKSIRGLLSSAFFLCGMRYNDERIAEVFGRLNMVMEASTTYRATIRKGEKRILLRQGTKRFGPPPAAVEKALQDIRSSARLQRIADRILEATDWNDLLSAK